MEELLNNVWQYKELIIIFVLISLIITILGFIKRNIILIIICLILSTSGSSILFSAWNKTKDLIKNQSINEINYDNKNLNKIKENTQKYLDNLKK